MGCFRCQYGRDKSGVQHHAEGCPESGGSYNAYETGWLDGRQGKVPVTNNPSYMLGYREGEIAAEEAENGDQAWGY